MWRILMRKDNELLKEAQKRVAKRKSYILRCKERYMKRKKQKNDEMPPEVAKKTLWSRYHMTEKRQRGDKDLNKLTIACVDLPEDGSKWQYMTFTVAVALGDENKAVDWDCAALMSHGKEEVHMQTALEVIREALLDFSMTVCNRNII